jgi:hypothetical protein
MKWLKSELENLNAFMLKLIIGVKKNISPAISKNEKRLTIVPLQGWKSSNIWEQP